MTSKGQSAGPSHGDNVKAPVGNPEGQGIGNAPVGDTEGQDKGTGPEGNDEGKGNDKAPAQQTKGKGKAQAKDQAPITPKQWFGQSRETDFPTTTGGNRINRMHECYLIFSDKMWTKDDVRVRLNPSSQQPMMKLHFEIKVGDTARRAEVWFPQEIYTVLVILDDIQAAAEYCMNDIPSDLPVGQNWFAAMLSINQDPGMKPRIFTHNVEMRQDVNVCKAAEDETIMLLLPPKARPVFDYMESLRDFGTSFWHYRRLGKESGWNDALGQCYAKQARRMGNVGKPVPRPPPHLTKARTSQVVQFEAATKFCNLAEYERVMKLAILGEMEAVERENDLLLDFSIRRRGRVVNVSRGGKYAGIEIEVLPDKNASPFAKIKGQDELLVKWYGDVDGKNMEQGRLVSDPSTQFIIAVKTKDPQPIGAIVHFFIKIQTNHEPLRRQLDAVSGAVQRQRHPKTLDLECVLLGSGPVTRVDVQEFMDGRVWGKANDLAKQAFVLDDTQDECYEIVFSEGVPGGLFLIHGPPGCGKTFLGACIALVMAASGLKVLLTADSNTAVNKLLKDVMLKGIAPYADELRGMCGGFLRLNTVPTTISELRTQDFGWETDEDVEDNADLDFSTEANHARYKEASTAATILRWIIDNPTSENWKDLGDQISFARQVPAGMEPPNVVKLVAAVRWAIDEILQDINTRIVASTLSNASTAKKYDWDVPILDENCQASETSTLIALATGPKLAILIGDPKQLAPKVASTNQGVNVYGKQLALSLFERHQALGHQVKMLGWNYRMHPDISAHPNIIEYGGLLRNVPLTEADTDLARWWKAFSKQHHSFRNTEYRRVFVHVDGEAKKPDGSTSWACEAFGRVVVSIIQDMLAFTHQAEGKTTRLQSRNIAVITAYTAQQVCIKQKLDEAGMGIKILVEPVDVFQGEEADFVILDFTSSNNIRENSVGFVGDARRFNVARTRAKIACVVVGNYSQWKAHVEGLRKTANVNSSSWKFGQFVDDVSLQHSLVTWSSISAALPPQHQMTTMTSEEKFAALAAARFKSTLKRPSQEADEPATKATKGSKEDEVMMDAPQTRN